MKDLFVDLRTTLKSRYTARTVESAVASAVEEWLPEVQDRGFRMDLPSLCERKSIALRHQSSSEYEGCFSVDESNVSTVRLRGSREDAQRLPRNRFTLAHELGHWIIYRITGIQRQNLFRGVPLSLEEEKIEEQLADQFAAEILMPTCKMKEITHKTLSAKLIQDGVNQFNVSRFAFIQRFATCAKRSIVCVKMLPSKFNDPRSFAFVDDVWHFHPSNRLRRARKTFRFADPIPFDRLQSSLKDGVEVQCDGEYQVRTFECQYRYGLVPRALLISAEATTCPVTSG